MAKAASTIYEVREDGSYRSVSPEGQEHLGCGPVPVDCELDPDEGRSLIEQRLTTMQRQEKEGEVPPPPVRPLYLLQMDGPITDEQRAEDTWKKEGWGVEPGSLAAGGGRDDWDRPSFLWLEKIGKRLRKLRLARH